MITRYVLNSGAIDVDVTNFNFMYLELEDGCNKFERTDNGTDIVDSNLFCHVYSSYNNVLIYTSARLHTRYIGSINAR